MEASESSRSEVPRRLLALGLLALLSAVVAQTAQSASSGRTAETCSGVWRWPVKTLGDRPKLKTLKGDVQVSQLWPLESPEPLSKKRARISGLETTIYTVTAKLMYARDVDDPPDSHGNNGGDLDFHLVIADPKDTAKTMIVEFPDPNCAKGATRYRRLQMAAARAAFVADCHGAPRTGFANLSGTATITGVGFYDTPHANGRSKHGVELHPVLKFESANCAWTS
jgi:hypothetical protein